MIRVEGKGRYTVLAGILVLGFTLRVWGLGWGLHNADVSRRPHPDEWPIYWLFRWFDSSHTLNPCPRSPGECFFDWGAVYPTIAYALHFVMSPFFALLPAHAFGSRADPQFVWPVLSGRLTSALFSTATIGVIYRLGKRAFGVPAGLIAALVVALSGLLIQLAHFATPDSTTLFLMCCTLLLAYEAMDRPSTWRFVLAGCALGAAAGAEYQMALLALPLATAWWLSGRRDVALLAAAYGSALVAFLVLNPFILIDFQGFLAATEHTLKIRTVDSSLQYGDRWAPYGPAWLYVVRYPLGYGVGFAVAAWMLVGVAWSAIRRGRADYLLLAWILPYFLLVTLEPAKFMRYSAPLLVPLAVMAARFGVEVFSGRRALMKSAVALTAALSLAFSGVNDAAYAGLFASPDPRAVAATWVVAHSDPRTPVSYEELPDGLVNLPYFISPKTRACFSQYFVSRLRGARYVLLDSYTPEEQPASVTHSIQRFRLAIERSKSYREAIQVHYVPTFLGLRFPIDDSPHDWRYPAHEITVYENMDLPDTAEGACFGTLAEAHDALYEPPVAR